MNKKKSHALFLIVIYTCLLYFIGLQVSVFADDPGNKDFSVLTYEEQQFISQNPIVDVCFITGIAPYIYMERGETKGIVPGILQLVEMRTGLTFRYREVYDYDELMGIIKRQESDLLGGIPGQYIRDELLVYHRSKPYMTTSSVLFMHKGVDVSKLSDYTFASIIGGHLPEGIDEGDVRYYDNREAALDAVEKGESDYTYANEYSVAYYSMKKGYKNTITIPEKMESRDYYFLSINDDDRLISIINKAMDEISDDERQGIIFRSASQIDKDVTLSVVMDTYGTEIILIISGIAVTLAVLSYFTYKSRKRYKKKNMQYMLLSGISGEYIYEYDVLRDLLILSGECSTLLRIPKVIRRFKSSEFLQMEPQLLEMIETWKAEKEITLTLENRDTGVFKIVNSVILDKDNSVEYIIGKLINISEEKKKFNKLQIKAQTDGLTRLYNYSAIEKLVDNESKSPTGSNALFVIDVDRFKDVNDTYGHPIGNKVLKEVSAAIKETFRDSDFVGRIGGDELCVFMSGNITEDIVVKKCKKLVTTYKSSIDNEEISITISIGVALNKGVSTCFEELYKIADESLYHVKKNGRNNYYIKDVSSNS